LQFEANALFLYILKIEAEKKNLLPQYPGVNTVALASQVAHHPSSDGSKQQISLLP